MVLKFKNAKREIVQLWIAISIVMVLSAYRLTSELLPELQAFFAVYTEVPIALYLLNGLFFWLLGLLWVAYRRWREALIAQMELEHVLMSISPDSLVVINRDRVITMCSGQVEAMFGIRQKDLIGKKTDVLYFDRRLRGEKGEIANRLEQFGFHVGYATGKRVDGGTFPLEVITGAIRFQQGAVILMRDITERCNIEDALRYSENKQEAAEREHRKIEQQMLQSQKLESLGVMAGGIAHDFNNLLMGMLGHADLALNQIGDTTAVQQHIEAVVSSAQRAAELSNQLLAYSGEGKFQLEVVSLSDVVEDLSGLLKVSIAKKAVLHMNLDRSLPPVECDPTQIRQVLMNMIVNASDALENRPGTITVETGKTTLTDGSFNNTVTAGEPLAQGDYVYVRVSDTGVGMDEDTVMRIFDPFFTTKFAGHGLGLAAALGIVRSHHGMIAIESSRGHGSAFTVYLPITEKALTPSLPPDADLDSWQGGGGTVLLADDEKTVRDVTTMMLESIGFAVISVENGREAIEAAHREGSRLKAILLDLTMPEVGGVDAFHAIREFNSHIPIVLSSGYNKEDDVVIPSDISRPLFLKKPYRMDAIRSVLKRALFSV